MNLRVIMLWLFPVLFISCRNNKMEESGINKLGDTVAAYPSFQNSGYKTFKGLFVSGKNMLTFRICDHPERDLAVMDSTGKMKDMYKAVFLHTPAFPYEFVYVEVKGTLSEADEESRKRGYDSMIIVNEVLAFEQKNYQNSCIPYDFWILGKDWSLQISENEQVLVLKDFTTMKVYVFEYFPPKKSSEELFTYASNNYASGAAIKTVIRKEACTDSSGNAFQYSATAVVNGKVYRGCAIKGTN
ncbi:MAG: hypothetical protein ABIQ74_09820 [Chitinophagales bacterium]